MALAILQQGQTILEAQSSLVFGRPSPAHNLPIHHYSCAVRTELYNSRATILMKNNQESTLVTKQLPTMQPMQASRARLLLIPVLVETVRPYDLLRFQISSIDRPFVSGQFKIGQLFEDMGFLTAGLCSAGEDNQMRAGEGGV